MSLGQTVNRLHCVFHFKRRNNECFENDTSSPLFRAI